MKKIIGLCMIMVVFMGCELPTTDDILSVGYKEELQTQIYYGDFSTIKTQADVIPWIRSHVIYKSDPEGENVINSLSETIALGYGDCEEFALLYLDIMYVKFDVKGQFQLVNASARQVANGGDCNHAVVYVNNIQIEPQTGYHINYGVAFYYDFDEIFY